jgi:phosphatidylserine/phosphatidylglycerophosphate/cardiolipin synthase-like enzyme
MSTSASGSVVDETGAGISGLSIELEDISRILLVPLAKGVTNSAGQFSLSYAGDLPVSSQPGQQARQLRLRILQGQHVLKEVVQDDTAQSALTFAAIQMQAAETSSWWATLGTGAPMRVTHGNAVRWLVDNEDAWAHVEDVIENAKTLDVMQLEIDIDEYENSIYIEKPRVVLRFDPEAPLTALNRRNLDAKDRRIERSLLTAAQRGVDIRIQIPKMTTDRHGEVVIGAITGLGILLMLGGAISAVLVVIGAIVAVLGVAALSLLLYAEPHYLSNQFGKQELAKWFERAIQDVQSQTTPAPQTPALGTVRVGELRLRSNFVTHAKMIIDRDNEAVVLGSPFTQVYFDSQHVFDEPKRGRSAAKGPIHDVSVGVRGPAVGHLQELFNSHWNIAEPSDKLPETPALPTAPQTLKDREFRCSVQVVRTLDSMFPTATDSGKQGNGEKGVLEAYLRAIHHAERFIYIENQYFNNDAITEALIDALVKKPVLQVILLLNACPDMPFYLGWQQKAIRRISDALFKKSINPYDRLGVFSTWTHASAKSTSTSKPTLIDNYLHTKTALVDNRWATVGSANLDGASLDFVQYFRAFLDGEVRNTETNIVVFEETGAQPSAVDALRRRLWSEHLGFPSPTDSGLDDAPDKKWLPVWRERATAKLAGLMQNLDNVSAIRVLPWPPAAFEESLGICRILKMHNSHATATAYLRSILSPVAVPSDVVAEGGPDCFEFTYGAFPNPFPGP